MSITPHSLDSIDESHSGSNVGMFVLRLDFPETSVALPYQGGGENHHFQ